MSCVQPGDDAPGLGNTAYPRFPRVNRKLRPPRAASQSGTGALVAARYGQER